MKRLIFLGMFAVAAGVIGSARDGSAQSQKKMSMPHVAVTYPDDTREAMMRRAQWLEGAKKEGQMVWWGITSPAEAEKTIAEFNKVYPFIKVTYWRGEGEDIAAKLEAESISNRYSVDICLGGEPINYPRWREKGLLGKVIDVATKSGKDMLDRKMFGKQGDWVMAGFAPKIPQYNTNLVSAAEAPKNWEDLADPVWKKQIGMVTDMKTWWALALAEGGWGVEKTEAFLAKLKQQEPIWAGGLVQSHSMLIAGEYKIMAAGNLRHVILSRNKNAPVDWVRAKPVVVTGSSFLLHAKGPHPNAARLFMEWLLSPQGLQTWANITAQYVPNTNTQTDKLMRGLPVVFRTEEMVFKGIEMNLEKRFGDILGIKPE